ncbi:DNA-binding protein, partial [Micromonospora craterilacus]
MRYADSGGLSAAGRVKREQVRMRAARMSAVDVPATRVAARLR